MSVGAVFPALPPSIDADFPALSVLCAATQERPIGRHSVNQRNESFTADARDFSESSVATVGGQERLTNRSVRVELGKINSLRFGMGGYQDAMFGAAFDLGGKGWGVADFRGTWATRSEGAQWTVADQRAQWADMVEYLRDLCKAANVATIDKLVGKPVEITFDGNLLKSWRVLTEVI